MPKFPTTKVLEGQLPKYEGNKSFIDRLIASRRLEAVDNKEILKWYKYCFKCRVAGCGRLYGCDLALDAGFCPFHTDNITKYKKKLFVEGKA